MKIATNLRKLALALAIALVGVGDANADPSDLMIAAMDNGRGERTVHTQANANDCEKLLAHFKLLQEQQQRMQLTLTDPPFSGYVIDLHRIRPDGTFVGQNGIERPQRRAARPSDQNRN